MGCQKNVRIVARDKVTQVGMRLQREIDRVAVGPRALPSANVGVTPSGRKPLTSVEAFGLRRVGTPGVQEGS